MAVEEDDLRLAWWEHRQGRDTQRIALMTLAVAGAGVPVPWARRGFRWLVARVPGHPFASFEGLAEALDDPRLARKLQKLRQLHPPDKVAWRLTLVDALRGPYTGRRESIAAIIDELWPVRLPRQRTAGRIDPSRLGVTRPANHRPADRNIPA